MLNIYLHEDAIGAIGALDLKVEKTPYRSAIIDFVDIPITGHIEAENGMMALEKLKVNPDICLALLDVMLPGIDGYEVCRRIRAKSNVPVLFLSARDTELDKVVGLELGGDDYLAKPFGIRELLARVHALLRRAPQENESAAEGARILDVSGIHLDEARHRATFDGKDIDLTPREFELLVTLMSHAGTVLGREQLLREAWDWQYVVETKTVDTHIKRLRDKLSSVGLSPNVIETVRGYGYRFVQDFENK